MVGMAYRPVTGGIDVQLINTSDELSQEQQQELHDKHRRLQLARLLRITETMLGQAQAGHWQEVEELETLRKTEIDQCFDMQNEQPSLLIAEALATLINLNDQIVHLVRNARNCLAEEHQFEAGKVLALKRYSESIV